MRRFVVRLAKLESACPARPPVLQEPTSSLKLTLEKIVEKAKRFERLTPREQVVEIRADLRAYRAKLLAPQKRVPGLAEKLSRLDLANDITRKLHEAEVRFLHEQGYQDAAIPIQPHYRELLDDGFFAD